MLRRFIFFLLPCISFAALLASCSVYTKPGKVDAYLYETAYSKYDFGRLSRLTDFLLYRKSPKKSDSLRVARHKAAAFAPACSAVRKGEMFGRNFDWCYDGMPEFVIRVEAGPDRFASIGVAAPIAVISDRQVRSLRGRLVLDLLPVMTVDGINERGVACCVNVVPRGDAGLTVGTNPGKPKLCAPLAVRYVLDHAENAAQAVALLSERSIYTTSSYGLNEEYHFMIADSVDTYVVEFVDNKLVALKDERVMTNWYLSRGVTPHAMGLERYDILQQGLDAAVDVHSMRELLKRVWYTRKYNPQQQPLWLSELCSVNGHYGLTTLDLKSAPEKFVTPFNAELSKFCNRDRRANRKKAGTWQSVHTSVYNLTSRSLTVSSQESDRIHRYRLETASK